MPGRREAIDGGAWLLFSWSSYIHNNLKRNKRRNIDLSGRTKTKTVVIIKKNSPDNLNSRFGGHLNDL